MSEKITGKIIVIGETIQVTEKFSKREIVVETTDDMYPQTIPMQFTQDKCSVLDEYVLGDEVEVSVNIQGRLWTNPEGVDKYFLSLNGWRIEKTTAKNTNGVPKVEGNIERRFQDEAIDNMTEDSDLPF